MPEKSYLQISTSRSLTNKKERIFFRLLEILPGFLSWATLVIVFLLSWLKPLWVAGFIILFDFYWLIRAIYLSFYLRAAYKKMRQYEKKDWLAEVKKMPRFENIYHLIILPMYKEPLTVVKSTFEALKQVDYPKEKMFVVLATEERAGKEDQETAKIIERDYGRVFSKFLITCHPANLPGEIAGKGSNETWAARIAKREIIDKLKIPYENVIFSSLDVDTVVFRRYFSRLTYCYLTVPRPLRASYQPIPLYINNIWEASIFSRVFAFSSTFWHTMNQERPARLWTFSSHSMPFKALVDVGFKQKDVVSDDSRIFWQCFLYYDGDYRTEPLFYPLSMDAIAGKTFWQTLKNLYKQQRRWAYGASEIAYFLFAFSKNRKIPIKRKFSLAAEAIESHWSWATAPLLIFLLGWLPLVLGGSAFRETLIAYNLPRLTSNLLTISMVGLISSIYFSMLLLPPKPLNLSKWRYFVLVLQWFLFPVMMIFFSALPALDAQTRLMLGRYMGFWVSPKTRKKLVRLQTLRATFE